jgi:DNA-binding XRE family transcriptional regulator
MKKEQRDRLEQGGWKLGSAADLLELTAAEEALIETKEQLGGILRGVRLRSGLSQAELAKRIGSSQPRVAKLENQDREVSTDLQLKAIFAARPQARREFAALIGKWAGSTSARPPRRLRRPSASRRSSAG